MKYRCNKCGTKFESGMSVRCPKCDETMDVEPVRRQHPKPTRPREPRPREDNAI